MVVSHEQCLDALPPQEQRVLSHLFSIVIFPLTIGILGIEVIFFGRNEGRLLFLLIEGVPIVLSEPNVLLHFLRSIQPQPVYGFPLNKLVDEISGF